MVSKGDFLASITAHFLPQRGLRLLRRPHSSKATVKKARKSQQGVMPDCVNTVVGGAGLLSGDQWWDMRKWSEAGSGKVQTRH